MPTIFSKIIAGEAPADIVYRDDRVTCFRDINPAAPVHILIIPNREIATVNDLGEEVFAVVGRGGHRRVAVVAVGRRRNAVAVDIAG